MALHKVISKSSTTFQVLNQRLLQELWKTIQTTHSCGVFFAVLFCFPEEMQLF